MSRLRGQRIRERVPAIFWTLSFAVQLLLAPAAILWTSGLLGEWLRLTAQPYAFLDEPMRILLIVLPDFGGFLFGLAARRLPGVVREPGRWIWTVPALICVCLLTLSTFVNLDLFFISILGVRGNDYSGSGIVRIVFPLGAVCLYSIGLRSGDRYTDPLKGAEMDYEGPHML